jgi:hypothetical protein
MATPVKLLITSKENLTTKYEKGLKQIENAVKQLVQADKKKGILTQLVYIDGPSLPHGVKPASAVTAKECKRVVDDLYHKINPAYIVILGAQDVIPFQELVNPADDDDETVDSDLPYACEAGYGRNVHAFTGPTRVVGRIPDIPGSDDASYLVKLITNSIRHKPLDAEKYSEYFSISAQVWSKSTQLSLQSMFGHSRNLLLSPPAPSKGKHNPKQLKPLVHFYNCHGAQNDACYYGQKGDDYPESLRSTNLKKNVSFGTVIAAECCYGAELVDPSLLDANGTLSIANTYLHNDAISFVGSSTIAYGPADSQGLADLLTQYFIKYVLEGASTGRALLEARHKFLAAVGPHLDPYELKTIAQFHLLGDPSLQPVKADEENVSFGNSTLNHRMKLMHKGHSLKKELSPSKKLKGDVQSGDPVKLKKLLKQKGFDKAEKRSVYEVKASKGPGVPSFTKSINGGAHAVFRSYIKHKKIDNHSHIQVLVVKESANHMLGWRTYVSR